jgi:hypothetical protein
VPCRALVDYWEYRISISQLIQQLRRLSGEPEPVAGQRSCATKVDPRGRTWPGHPRLLPRTSWLAQDVGAQDEPGRGAFRTKTHRKRSDELPFDFPRTGLRVRGDDEFVGREDSLMASFAGNRWLNEMCACSSAFAGATSGRTGGISTHPQLSRTRAAGTMKLPTIRLSRSSLLASSISRRAWIAAPVAVSFQNQSLSCRLDGLAAPAAAASRQ